MYHRINRFVGARPHTRASLAANHHVRASFPKTLSDGTLEQFKMAQFKKVSSRVGSHHVNGARR